MANWARHLERRHSGFRGRGIEPALTHSDTHPIMEQGVLYKKQEHSTNAI